MQLSYLEDDSGCRSFLARSVASKAFHQTIDIKPPTAINVNTVASSWEGKAGTFSATNLFISKRTRDQRYQIDITRRLRTFSLNY